MGVYDPDYDNIEAVCLVGTGFSDEFLKKWTEVL